MGRRDRPFSWPSTLSPIVHIDHRHDYRQPRVLRNSYAPHFDGGSRMCGASFCPHGARAAHVGSDRGWFRASSRYLAYLSRIFGASPAHLFRLKRISRAFAAHVGDRRRMCGAYDFACRQLLSANICIDLLQRQFINMSSGSLLTYVGKY
jgi:hypothetical protein